MQTLIMDIYFSFIGLALIIVGIINSIYSHIYKIVNMPSAPQTRKAIINNLKSEINNDDGIKIIDLGSGWGGLCSKLSKHFPKAKIEGIEISPIPFLTSKIFQYLYPFRHYRIKRNDLFKMDISSYDVIICYLSPYHMDRFENDLLTQCKSGTILYSQGFPLKNKTAEAVIEIPYSLEKKLYKYIF